MTAAVPRTLGLVCKPGAERATEIARGILEHIEELVVKPADGSGGYGLLVGSHASAAECERMVAAARASGRPAYRLALAD